MTIDPLQLLLLCLLFFTTATLYSSVGFGGGSSYLAILSLFLLSFFMIRSIALVCNILVVSGGTYWYIRKGHFNVKQFLPFVLTSVPMAYWGASLRLQEEVFFIILGLALMVSSLFLVWQTLGYQQDSERRTYPIGFNYLLGAGIGFLSGMMGIGGGIFLAPILHHMRWNTSITIAALASFFILVNSISGFAGLVVTSTLILPLPETAALAVAVLLGGQIGIRLSIKRLTAKGIRRVTALLVFVVGIRVLLVNGLHLL